MYSTFQKKNIILNIYYRKIKEELIIRTCLATVELKRIQVEVYSLRASAKTRNKLVNGIGCKGRGPNGALN